MKESRKFVDSCVLGFLIKFIETEVSNLCPISGSAVTLPQMQDRTDQELLAAYAQRRSEDAFTELVRRHIDLVYSAALRMVCDPHLAQDVTQSAFAALAQNATTLAGRSVLSGWLHRTTQNLAANVVRSEVRRRVREQKAVVMNELLSAESNVTWEQIAPNLDAALGELDETDRDAVLLRYFEKKSAREIAQILGVSDEAAQKRVSRAVERLREFFSKRNVIIGASGLTILISANAVQSAPAGLLATISATVLAGTAASTSTAIAVTKVIAMTTLQKTLVTVTVAVLAGTGIYEATQASRLREQNQTLQQQQTPLAAQFQQLQREYDDATNRLAAVTSEIAQLKSAQNQAELLKLRGQVGTLQKQVVAAETKPSAPATGISKMMSDPAMKEYIHQSQINLIKSRYGDLFQELKLTPEQTDKFVQVMGDTMLKHTEKVSTLPPDAVHQAEIAQELSGTKTDMESELQSLLGDTGFARFKEFTGEIPARTTVKLLNEQLGKNQLNNEQDAQLRQVVKAEPFDLTHGISGDLDKAFFGSQEDIDNYLLKVAESNQRVLQQAGSFLTPDQLGVLNTVLTNGINARTTQAAALVQKH
jgi:RNA polymerase sigma factor (sigma-70 family)